MMKAKGNHFFGGFLERLIKQRVGIPTLKYTNLFAIIEEPCLRNAASTATPFARGGSNSLLIGSRDVDHQLLGTAVRRD